jgi:hypothetical protein
VLELPNVEIVKVLLAAGVDEIVNVLFGVSAPEKTGELFADNPVIEVGLDNPVVKGPTIVGYDPAEGATVEIDVPENGIPVVPVIPGAYT